MGHFNGRVREIRLGASGQTEFSILCPPDSIPAPGQYLLGIDQQDDTAVLPVPLFLVNPSNNGFWAAPLHPLGWVPGVSLNLVGPLGHGFDLPANIRRLGLVALGETISRLLPLVAQAAQGGAGMTLFTDLSLPALPSAIEIYPLISLRDTLDWPDYLVLDLPLRQVEGLRQVLGLGAETILPCPAQVLITAPMPCAALAHCGACAVPARRGWKLVCEDGPVFDLKGLRW